MGSIKKAKLLMFALVVVGVLAIGLMISTIVLGIQLKSTSEDLNKLKKQPKICTSPGCVKAAGEMMKSMDPTVDPCQDFYHFACGNWVKNNPIPETSSSWNQFNVLRERLTRNIREILETHIVENDPKPLILAKQLYDSCMQQDTVNQSELFDLIEFEFDVSKAKEDLTGILSLLRRKVWAPLIINLYVQLDEQNASNYIIYLDQPELGLGRPFLIDLAHQNRNAYKELIQAAWPLVYIANSNVGDTEYARIAKDIVDFETKIANISTSPEKRRNRTELYNLMTLQELGKYTVNATMINWETYVTEVFKDVKELHNVDLGDFSNLKVVVRDKLYFKEFGHILADTDNDVIVNYLRWRLIFGLGNDVSEKLREIFFDFTRKTQGTQFPSPRWQICSDKANLYFGMAISYKYVGDALGSDFTSQMDETILNIQAAMNEIIDTVPWIVEEETRVKAKLKASMMRNFIGYPNWLLKNLTALDAYYKGISISTSENLFRTVLEISHWRNMEDLRKIMEKKDVERWITDPTIVNAYYSFTDNSISFPAGILQPPFYFIGNPIQALNYGAIGAVIGHEVTHGFDDRGRQSDGDGNLIDWWDEGTVEAYIKKAQCFIDQYSNYTAEEVNAKLNGINTLGENIADNGGVRESFVAYQKYTRAHGEEEHLPGLKYTPEQLFFIAFSQIWCGSYTPQGMLNQIKTGSHSPNRFRVKGVVENSNEFAQTWNCTPSDKVCKIW